MDEIEKMRDEFIKYMKSRNLPITRKGDGFRSSWTTQMWQIWYVATMHERYRKK